jgi:hypothetical protein
MNSRTLARARHLSPAQSSKPFRCLCGCNDELENLKPAECSMPGVSERVYCEVHLECFEGRLEKED